MTSWDQIERNFRELGLDPYRLACGCSVKADLESVVYPALEQIRPQLQEWGISLAPRQEADIALGAGAARVHRLVFLTPPPAPPRHGEGQASPAPFAVPPEAAPDSIWTVRLGQPRAGQDEGQAKLVQTESGREGGQGVRSGEVHALTLTSAYRPTAQALAQQWLSVYKNLADAGLKFTVGKGHTIVADSPEHQLVLFDLLTTPRHGEGRSWMVSNHDTIQLIDLTLDPADFRQTAAALSNALNDLFALGAVEHIQIFPAVAAPTEPLFQKILNNIREFAARFGFTVIEQAPLPVRTLLLGATVIAQTDHRPPVFSEEIRPGDQMLVHRALGELAPINLHLESLVLGEDGLDRIFRAKEQALEILARPNLAVGRLISQYAPAVGEPFDPERHIKIAGDLSGAGLGVVRELGVPIEFGRIPFLFEDLVERALEHRVVREGTVGTNGAIFVIAAPKVIERFGADLASLGYEPHVIGRVICRGVTPLVWGGRSRV